MEKKKEPLAAQLLALFFGLSLIVGVVMSVLFGAAWLCVGQYGGLAKVGALISSVDIAFLLILGFFTELNRA